MTVVWTTVTAYLKGLWKAATAAVAGGATYLLGVWEEDDAFYDAFATMTGVQWLGFTLAVLGAWGLTARATR
jgi:hypothetical protein